MTSSWRRTLPLAMWLLVVIAGQITSTTAVNCPNRCLCDWVLDSLSVNCSNLELSAIPDFSDLPIETLDLSNNRFTEFPTELSLLEQLASLDLSNNFISALPADALLGFKALRQLYLRSNNITNWRDISPNQVLLNAMHLETFSLAGNPLLTFSTNDQRLVLISSSLTTLDLSFCKISKISGSFALQGLAGLENLILAGNPLHGITKLESQTLRTLDLSGCEFLYLPSNTFLGLSKLYAVDLSRNSKLTMEPTANGFVYSKSLRQINLSFCNMPVVYLGGFPNLTAAFLKNNMIQEVHEMTFRQNAQIEVLDLSSNVIKMLAPNAFTNLRVLKQLDLSVNMIAELDRNMFMQNELLTNLNLSQNMLSKFTRLSGTSIVSLDLSSCGITSIAADACSHMPIRELNLSSNLISSLPPGFASQTLQTLDLNLNRISSITNNTFGQFPELTSLNLSGNRFTTPFRPDFFRKNQYLRHIALEDNPWRCDCKDNSFKQFFIYLTQTPPKITNTRTLKCTSPESSFGRTWDSVCFAMWFPRQNLSTIEKFWAVALSCLAVLFFSVCTYRLTRKIIKKKKQRRNASELRENLEEQRRVQSYSRQMLQQDAQLNAPDPHETNPPSYEIALLMPPLKRLTKSYVDITVKESNEAIDQPDCPVERNNRNRYHSDNTLLNGENDERTAKIRRTPSFRRHAPRSRRGSRLVAVRPPRCPDGKMKTSESLGKMSNFVSFDNSPYTRRKPRSTTTSSISQSSSIDHLPDSRDPASYVPLRKGSLDFVENYYVRPKSISNSGDDYEIVSSQSDIGSKRTSIRSSNSSTEVGIVIVHNTPSADNQAPGGESRERKESQF